MTRNISHFKATYNFFGLFLSLEWNSKELGGPAHGIVTKTVHETLPGVGGGEGVVGLVALGVVVQVGGGVPGGFWSMSW